MYTTACNTFGFSANPYNGTFPSHYYPVGFHPTAHTQTQVYGHGSWPAQATLPAAFTYNQQYATHATLHTVSNSTQSYCTASCHSADIETPTFSGSHDTEKWHNFISLFEKVCKINGFDTETKRLHLLACLRDDALEFADILELRIAKDYELLKASLAKRFSVSRNECFYRQQFKNRNRLQNETLEQYLQELWYLAEHTFRDDCTSSNILYLLIGDQFISGIQNESLRTHLSLNRIHYGNNGPSMLKDMLKDAELYESLSTSQQISYDFSYNATKGDNYSYSQPVSENSTLSESQFCTLEYGVNCSEQISYEQPSLSGHLNEGTSLKFKGSSEEIFLETKGSESQAASKLFEEKGSETQSFCYRVYDSASVHSCGLEVNDSNLGLTCNDNSLPCGGDFDLTSLDLKSSGDCAPSNGDNCDILNPRGDDLLCADTQIELSSPLYVDIDMSHACLEARQNLQNDSTLRPLESSDSSEESPICESSLNDLSTLDFDPVGINGKEQSISIHTEEKPNSISTPELTSQIKSIDFHQLQLNSENKLSLGLRYTAIMYLLSYQSRKKVKMKVQNETLRPSDLRYDSGLCFKWKHLQQKRVKMKIFFIVFVIGLH